MDWNHNPTPGPRPCRDIEKPRLEASRTQRPCALHRTIHVGRTLNPRLARVVTRAPGAACPTRTRAPHSVLVSGGGRAARRAGVLLARAGVAQRRIGRRQALHVVSRGKPATAGRERTEGQQPP